MAKSPQSEKRARIGRTNSYAEKVRQILAASVNQILDLRKRVPNLASGIMYSFDGDTEKVRSEAEKIFRRMHSLAVTAIKQGILAEWSIANQECDALVKSCFGKKAMETPMFRAYTQRNTDAMQAFINRSERGMNLSDRVWKSMRQMRDELEVALTVSMGEGETAGAVSRRVRLYLNDPDLMFRRFRYKAGEVEIKDEQGNVIGKETVWGKKWKKAYRDEDGKLRFMDYDKDSYKARPGVYKSAARNAMRLARTETNMAYRNADHERWQQMDFVLGQRVQLSEKHPVYDICDELAGDYPKDFRFEGWHPQCFCFVTPILVDEEEMVKMTEAALNGEEYKPQGEAVVDYPKAFKDFVRDNEANIKASRQRGTEPYFLAHNKEVVDGILYPQSGDGGNKVPPTGDNTTTSFEDDGESEEEKRKRIEEHRKQYEELIKSSDWNGLGFNDNTGGYVVAHKDHNFAPTKPKGARLTGGEAEIEVSNILAEMGKQVKLLSERLPKGEKPADMEFDGITWDIKYIPTANEETIRKYIRDGRKADCVIFYSDKKNRWLDIISAFEREIGRALKNGYILPRIFIMHPDGTLEEIKKPPI